MPERPRDMGQPIPRVEFLRQQPQEDYDGEYQNNSHLFGRDILERSMDLMDIVDVEESNHADAAFGVTSRLQSFRSSHFASEPLKPKEVKLNKMRWYFLPSKTARRTSTEHQLTLLSVRAYQEESGISASMPAADKGQKIDTGLVRRIINRKVSYEFSVEIYCIYSQATANTSGWPSDPKIPY
ncbi:uncharacterized protein CLUP02_07400 [Colletotrichum lupini]|uniref:Uncharacterized protein n=1 Tax=Colletotrichum lupini TaxID=145971 RepID=A0A9Q8SQX2_9PEZI|nr:uncharacterized protein CLUP02_07400 [Colletotrichum lupini]UQC81914.1 hypothetical protein CLUP02_07400 [Colletotrichum lupini]